jgi:rSAM/selenodomain-associated transferase 1
MAAVLVMAKAARAGRVNTRLEPLLGPERCAALQARLIAASARLAAAVAPDGAFVCVDPPAELERVRTLVPERVRLFGQVEGDLGARLAAATAHLLDRTGGPLVTIGTDAPTLAPAHLRAALAELERGAEHCFGPALDGGYYLVAQRRPAPELFDLPAEEWGGPRVLELSLARAAGGTVLLEPLRDLDTPEDAAALLADPALPSDLAELLGAGRPEGP